MNHAAQQTDKDLQKKITTLKVLIVDDQQEVRWMVRDVLDEVGIKTIMEATNGKEAARLIDSDVSPVNLVICDWNMPTMNGVEFLRQVRTSHPELPFLMITGRADKDSVIEAKTAGVNAFIRKPFSPEQLEAKLKMLVQQTRQ